MRRNEAAGTVQAVKVLCKHKDLSLIPRAYIGSRGCCVYLESQNRRGRDRKIPGVASQPSKIAGLEERL